VLSVVPSNEEAGRSGVSAIRAHFQNQPGGMVDRTFVETIETDPPGLPDGDA